MLARSANIHLRIAVYKQHYEHCLDSIFSHRIHHESTKDWEHDCKTFYAGKKNVL